MRIDGKTIGMELRALRIKNDLNVDEVCEKIGINRTSLYKYENNADDLKYKTLVQILDFYGTNPTIFFKIIGEYFHNKGE